MVDLILSAERVPLVRSWQGLWTGMHRAIRSGQVGVFERLLPHVCEHPGGFNGIRIANPLSLACQHGSLPIVKLLLDLSGDHA